MVVLTHALRWGSWFIEGPSLGVPNGPSNVLSDRLWWPNFLWHEAFATHVGGNGLKRPKIMVMTTWGRILPRFDFSIIDYIVMTGSQASKQGFADAWGLNKSQISN